MKHYNILIVEDEPIIAQHIAVYLERSNYVISGIAHDAADALQLLHDNKPDAAILDVNLEGNMDGVDIGSYIHDNMQIPFFYLTAYADASTLERAKATHPCGYIVKPFNEKTLLASLEMVLYNFQRGNTKAPAEICFDQINKHLTSPVSRREFNILEQIYKGLPNRRIAEDLYVSMNTVKKHINNTYIKLDVNSRSTAIARIRELMFK